MRANDYVTSLAENVGLKQFLGSLDAEARGRMAEVLQSIGYDLSRQIPLTYVQTSVTCSDPLLPNAQPRIVNLKFPQGALVLFTTSVVQGLRISSQDPLAPNPIPAQLDPRDYVEGSMRRVATQELVTDYNDEFVALTHWTGTAGRPYVWPKVPYLGSNDEIQIKLRLVPGVGLERVARVQIGFGIFQAPAGVNV
jgi:hypothetical protein